MAVPAVPLPLALNKDFKYWTCNYILFEASNTTDRSVGDKGVIVSISVAHKTNNHVSLVFAHLI